MLVTLHCKSCYKPYFVRAQYSAGCLYSGAKDLYARSVEIDSIASQEKPMTGNSR